VRYWKRKTIYSRIRVRRTKLTLFIPTLLLLPQASIFNSQFPTLNPSFRHFEMTNVDESVRLCFPLKTKTQSKEPKFEESLERLEALVQEMESGNLPLEEILKKYEEGNRLIKLCAAKLNEAEQRIEILMKEKNGSLNLTPMELKGEDEENSEDSASPPHKKTTEEKDLF